MKLFKYKRLFKTSTISLLLTTLFITPIFAETVTGIDITNNTNINSDYKVSEEQIKKIVSGLPITSVIKETLDTNAGREINVNNKELSYLIEHNIISRDDTITATSDGFNITKRDINVDADMSKSDFLMGVYKAVYGAINSRPVYHKSKAVREINGVKGEVVETSSYRPKGYDGNATSFTFPEGDFDIYVSPNIKELYLHELINKSIINSNDVLYDLNPTGKTWNNTLAPSEGEQGIFGQGYKVDKSGDTLSISPIETNYFVNENVTTIEALKLVESVLRLTEKDLSEREAKIISYKYGTSYLLELPKDVRGTIIYLIAMGVIDFENPGEYGNLYQELNSEFAYKLMYRLANKSGRKDFSKVVMTADDNYFMENGFVEQRVNIYDNFNKPMPETEEVKNITTMDDYELDKLNTDSGTTPENNGGSVQMTKADTKPNAPSFVNKILDKLGIETKTREVMYAAPSDGGHEYKIVKVFQDTQNIRYKGVRICNLNAERQKPEKKDKFKEIIDMHGGATDTVITFQISAPSAVQAVASVDSRITITDDSAKHEGNVNTITQVTVNGEKISYLSSKELKNKLSEIAVVNSKTLKNTKTGDMAVLLTDHKVALVGNSIIRSKGDMVRKINDIEYYNMDVVVPLMTNAYLSKIDPAKLYVSSKLPTEKIVPVYGSGATPIEFTPVVDSKAVVEGASTGPYMFNCNLLTRGVSTLIRDFDINRGGKKSTAKVIVDWNYAMPNNEDINNAVTKNTDGKFTVKGAADYLIHRPPTTGAAQDWWDNNIGISNALANAMYGSKNNNIQYVKSGFMVPSVYILTDDKEIGEQELVDQVFKEIRFPQGYRAKYMNNAAGTDFVKYLFNGDSAKSSLNAIRQFHVYRGNKSKEYMSYDNRFVTTQTNAVYRAFDSDPRVTLVTSGSKAGINIKARTDKLSTDDVGKKVKFNGKNFYIDGYSGTNKSGDYFRLIPTTAQKGTPKQKSGAWTLVNENGKDVIDEFVKANTKDVTNAALRWDKIPVANRTMRPPTTWVRGNAKTMKNEQILIGNKIKKMTFEKNSTGVSYKELKKEDVSTRSGETFCYPTIYLKRTEFAVVSTGKGQYELVLKRTNPYLNQGNIFYSGLNNSLISALLDKDSSSVSYEDLPNGARVLIEDIMYTKTSDGLTSDPTTNMARELNNAVLNESQAVKNVILKSFAGTSLNYSGRTVPLQNYIKEATLGNLLDKNLASNVMFKKGPNVKFLRDKGGDIVNKTKGDVPSNVCINLVFDNSVRFTQIDKDKGVYTLALNTDAYSNGYINDISYFYETLNLDGKDDLFIRLTEKTFKPLDRAGEFTHKFAEAYKDALVLDAKNMLRFTLTVIISYAIVMSWLVFAVVELNVGKNILLNVRDAFGKENSFDLIRYLTFGTVSLDSDIKAYSLLLGDIGLFLLLYYVIERL